MSVMSAVAAAAEQIVVSAIVGGEEHDGQVCFEPPL